MNYTVITYLVYIALSLLLTIWVANTLHKNGRVFLVQSFVDNEALADSVNHLLVVGFYLINIGYIALALREGATIDSLQKIIEVLSSKIGFVLVVLGFMHFSNLFIFSRVRKNTKTQISSK